MRAKKDSPEAVPAAARATQSHPAAKGATRAIDVFVVLTLAITIRASFFIVSLGDPGVRQTESDSEAFLVLGANLAEGRGFGRVRSIPPEAPAQWHPEPNRLPGYPSLIAGAGLLTGRPQTGTILLQHLLGVAMCVMATLVCGRMFGRKAGLAAGVLLALDLQGAALGNKILMASTFGFCIFIAALATGRVVDKPTTANALVAGVLVGISAFLRYQGVLLPAATAAILLVRGLARRRGRAIVAAVLLGFSGNAIIGAWVIRNRLVFGEYRYAQGDYHLLGAHAACALARGERIPLKQAQKTLCAQLGMDRRSICYLPLSPQQRAEVRALVFKTIRTYKSAFIKGSLIGSANTMFGPEKHVLTVLGLPWIHFGLQDPGGMVSRSTPAVSWLLLGAQVAFLGAVYGLVLKTLWRRLRGRKLPGLVWICLVISVCVVLPALGAYSDPRYRWPAIPLLVIVAVSAIAKRPAPRIEPSDVTGPTGMPETVLGISRP